MRRSSTFVLLLLAFMVGLAGCTNDVPPNDGSAKTQARTGIFDAGGGGGAGGGGY